MASGKTFSLAQAAAAAQKDVAVWWLGQPAVVVPLAQLLVRETVSGQVQTVPMGEEAACQVVAAARVDSAQAVAKAVPKEALGPKFNAARARFAQAVDLLLRAMLPVNASANWAVKVREAAQDFITVVEKYEKEHEEAKATGRVNKIGIVLSTDSQLARRGRFPSAETPQWAQAAAGKFEAVRTFAGSLLEVAASTGVRSLCALTGALLLGP